MSCSQGLLRSTWANHLERRDGRVVADLLQEDGAAAALHRLRQP